MKSLDIFSISYTALGGLGLFFLGLKYLSESLQTLAGELIRKIINFATSNRILAVLVGVAITAFVQSSSITTVMVVGLVNAGLMNLTQAIGVILGANVGTTITGWILVINVGKYGLLLIGLGIFPMLFFKGSKRVAVGKVVLALGLIFLGLEIMSGAFVPLRTNESFLAFLHYFNTDTILGRLGCVAIGCILTCIIQSSSAMLGITIALATTGSIDYPTAAALVLGENIGTTITAILASVGATVSARRAALSHALFNVIGVLIMLSIFRSYVSFIDSLVVGDPDLVLESGSKPNIAAHIAMGHTMFNITATLLMLPFLNQLAALVQWLLPSKEEEETHSLRFIGKPGAATVAVSLQMGAMELQNLTRIVRDQIRMTGEYLRGKEHNEALFAKIAHCEEVTDSVQKEITTFVCKVMENSLNDEQSATAYTLIQAADELETIADYCRSVSRFRYRLFRYKQDFSEDGWEDIYRYFDQISEFYDSVAALAVNYNRDAARAVPERAAALNRHADSLRENHLERMKIGTCKPLPALAFSDIVVAMRRVKNHTINFYQALQYSKSPAEELPVGSDRLSA